MDRDRNLLFGVYVKIMPLAQVMAVADARERFTGSDHGVKRPEVRLRQMRC